MIKMFTLKDYKNYLEYIINHIIPAPTAVNVPRSTPAFRAETN